MPRPIIAFDSGDGDRFDHFDAGDGRDDVFGRAVLVIPVEQTLESAPRKDPARRSRKLWRLRQMRASSDHLCRAEPHPDNAESWREWRRLLTCSQRLCLSPVVDRKFDRGPSNMRHDCRSRESCGLRAPACARLLRRFPFELGLHLDIPVHHLNEGVHCRFAVLGRLPEEHKPLVIRGDIVMEEVGTS